MAAASQDIAEGEIPTSWINEAGAVAEGAGSEEVEDGLAEPTGEGATKRAASGAGDLAADGLETGRPAKVARGDAQETRAAADGERLAAPKGSAQGSAPAAKMARAESQDIPSGQPDSVDAAPGEVDGSAETSEDEQKGLAVVAGVLADAKAVKAKAATKAMAKAAAKTAALKAAVAAAGVAVAAAAEAKLEKAAAAKAKAKAKAKARADAEVARSLAEEEARVLASEGGQAKAVKTAAPRPRRRPKRRRKPVLRKSRSALVRRSTGRRKRRATQRLRPSSRQMPRSAMRIGERPRSATPSDGRSRAPRPWNQNRKVLASSNWAMTPAARRSSLPRSTTTTTTSSATLRPGCLPRIRRNGSGRLPRL